MNALTRSRVELTGLFDRLGLTHAVMGGVPVRVYGIPRATYDIDFTLAIERDRLPRLFEAVEGLGYTVRRPAVCCNDLSRRPGLVSSPFGCYGPAR